MPSFYTTKVRFRWGIVFEEETEEPAFYTTKVRFRFEKRYENP